jgi:hypothetical protein
MDQILWIKYALNLFSKQMKAYEQKKDQSFLGAHDGVFPISIELKNENRKETEPHSEHGLPFPHAIGNDQSFKAIPEAKKSPSANTGEDDDYEDGNDDETEEECDEGEDYG